jgi:hypothetical protein
LSSPALLTFVKPVSTGSTACETVILTSATKWRKQPRRRVGEHQKLFQPLEIKEFQFRKFMRKNSVRKFFLTCPSPPMTTSCILSLTLVAAISRSSPITSTTTPKTVQILGLSTVHKLLLIRSSWVHI